MYCLMKNYCSSVLFIFFCLQRINMAGWCQVAFKNKTMVGVVVSGEAAMFAAQLAGPEKVRAGMNSPKRMRAIRFIESNSLDRWEA